MISRSRAISSQMPKCVNLVQWEPSGYHSIRQASSIIFIKAERFHPNFKTLCFFEPCFSESQTSSWCGAHEHSMLNIFHTEIRINYGLDVAPKSRFSVIRAFQNIWSKKKIFLSENFGSYEEKWRETLWWKMRLQVVTLDCLIFVQ